MTLRQRVYRAGLFAGVSIGALAFVVGCTPSPTPANYSICNSTGCGDNVTVEIVNSYEAK
jgi:hypothetical protein